MLHKLELADCAPGWTAVSVGEWTAVTAFYSGVGVSGSILCASPKSTIETGFNIHSTAVSDSTHVVSHEPCAICCATGPSVVGGFAEGPAAADASGGGANPGSGTYAVLVGGLAGALAALIASSLYVRSRLGR